MAEKLIKIAARRHLRPGDVLQMPPGVYDEFCAGFPYSETDDQARAIKDTLDDLTTGKPMDRLVRQNRSRVTCGPGGRDGR